MAALKEPVKIFIVQALACRDTPQEVVDLVKQEYGIQISRSQCQAYDPTKYSGRNLSKKFVDLFNKTRTDFDAGLIDIPIANKHYRLKQYQKQLERNAKNTVMSLKILEQAAKDAAVYNNIIELENGFDTLIGERGVTLSGGQKQRVSIARAIVKQPQVLIFDDCLSAVDTRTEEEILSNLGRIMHGKTSIIIAHRISTIKNADNIYKL